MNTEQNEHDLPPQSHTGDGRHPLLSAQVRLRVWFDKTLERCRESSEVERWGTVIAAVLGWVVIMYAMQILAYGTVGRLLVNHGIGLGGAQGKSIIQATSVLSTTLAYLPVLLLLPQVRSTLRDSKWLSLSSISVAVLPDKYLDSSSVDESDVSTDDGDVPSRKGIAGWTDRIKRRASLLLSDTSPALGSKYEASKHKGLLTGAGLLLHGIWIAIVCMILAQTTGIVLRLLGVTYSHTNNTTTSFSTLLSNLFTGKSPYPLLDAVVMAVTVLVVPVLEEVLYRGVVAKCITGSTFAYKYSNDGTSRHRTILRTFLICLVSGAVFGALHILSATSTSQAVLSAVSMTVNGTYLSWCALRYKSIWPGAVSHVLYNLIILVLMAM